MTKNTKTAWIVGLGAIAALWLWARSRGTSIGSLFSFSTSSSGLGVRPAGGTGVPGVIGSIGSGRGANVVDPEIVAARGAAVGPQSRYACSLPMRWINTIDGPYYGFCVTEAQFRDYQRQFASDVQGAMTTAQASQFLRR